MVFPLLINASTSAVPSLPLLNSAPLFFQRAVASLTSHEKRLSEEESCRFVAELFGLSKQLFNTIPEGGFAHYPTSRFHLPRAFTLLPELEGNKALLVHFNKKGDPKRLRSQKKTVSLAVNILSGKEYAWITSPITFRWCCSLKTESAVFEDLPQGMEGVVSTHRIFEWLEGKKGPKYALLQEFGSYTLKELFENQKPSSLLQYPQCLHLMKQLAAGLCNLHEREWIHNDIKPSNIILVKDPNTEELHAKLIDLECALSFDEAPFVSNVQGTLDYLAPEFYFYAEEFSLHGEKSAPCLIKEAPDGVSSKKDIWALGQVFYELLFGEFIEPDSKTFEKMVASCEESRMVVFLQKLQRKGKAAALIASMLHQNRSCRPSAAQVLQTLSDLAP